MVVTNAAEAGREQLKSYERQWIVILLPTVPTLLLLLRIWYFSHEDIDNTQLVIQNINPIGLIAALFLTLLWMLPTVVLVVRLIGLILTISVADPLRFRMARLAAYIPSWMLLVSVGVAAFTWEIQFLPVLLMLTLVVASIEAKVRFPAHSRMITLYMTVISIAAIILFYETFVPVALEAIRQDDHLTALLLLVPPPLAVILGGPLPAVVARYAVNAIAVFVSLSVSFIFVLEFTRSALLPVTAIEVRNPSFSYVLNGYAVNVDGKMTTFLDLKGSIHFVLNDVIVARVLCRDYSRAPYVDLTVRGWNIEESLLEAAASSDRNPVIDQRCFGRTA